jgi:pimeloyl-[acyl-carrier protein] methyl ester esterase
MSLHITKIGSGPDLVLLHGWGFNSTVWRTISDKLSEHFTLHLIDLPGYSQSPYRRVGTAHHSLTVGDAHPTAASQLAGYITRQTPDRAHYLGWSMGGTVAMTLALEQPERVNKLILVSSTARFVNNDTWQNGVANEVFQSFADELSRDYSSTIKRFLTLQSLGNPQQRQKIKALQTSLITGNHPNPEALQAGLQLLENTDLTDVCHNIKHNCLVVHSDDDKLVPLAAGRFLVEKLKHGQLAQLNKTGHIPFINQPDIFCQHVKSFLYA